MEDKVLAVVNGKNITESDYRNTLMRFPAERQGYFNSESGKKELLEQMVAFELIHEYAVSEKMNDDELYATQVELAKKELLTQYAINKVLSNVKIEEDEIKSFYESNSQMFMEDESVSAKHILVETEEKANEILAEINGGKLFEDAAVQYSSCPSKTSGGDLGYFTRGRMVPEFETAAFELEVGEVSQPVQTQFGYHLIKVEDKKAAEAKAYDDVKNSIYNDMMNQKQSIAYSNLVQDLTGKYSIEYK